MSGSVTFRPRTPSGGSSVANIRGAAPWRGRSCGHPSVSMPGPAMLKISSPADRMSAGPPADGSAPSERSGNDLAVARQGRRGSDTALDRAIRLAPVGMSSERRRPWLAVLCDVLEDLGQGLHEEFAEPVFLDRPADEHARPLGNVDDFVEFVHVSSILARVARPKGFVRRLPPPVVRANPSLLVLRARSRFSRRPDLPPPRDTNIRGEGVPPECAVCSPQSKRYSLTVLSPHLQEALSRAKARLDAIRGHL